MVLVAIIWNVLFEARRNALPFDDKLWFRLDDDAEVEFVGSVLT